MTTSLKRYTVGLYGPADKAGLLDDNDCFIKALSENKKSKAFALL
jgi:hypothetical protein